MAGLKGTQRGNFSDARIRRNWNRMGTLFNMLGTGIDLVEGQLEIALVAGDGIEVTGATIAVDLATDSGLQFTAGDLDHLLKAAGALAKDVSGVYVDISGLTSDASPTLADDVIVFEDITDGSKRKITFNELASAIVGGIDHGGLAGLADDDHLGYLLDDAATGGDAIVVTGRAVNLDPSKPVVAVPARVDVGVFDNGDVRSATLGDLADLALPANIGAAPDDASYVVIALDADLSAERQLTADDGLTLTDGGANMAVTLSIDVASPDSGLVLDPGGINVGAGQGLVLNGDAVDVRLRADPGLAFAVSDFLHVSPTDAAEITSIDGTADYLLISDDSDSDDVKKVLANNLPGVQNVNSYFAMSGKSLSLPGATTSYMSLSGTGGTTLAVAEFEVATAGTIKNLSTKVRSNGSAAGGNTLGVTINGTLSALKTTYGAAESGDKSDTSNTASVAAGDSLALQVVHAGGGFDGPLVADAATWEFIPA